jgi:hypothetical protein
MSRRVVGLPVLPRMDLAAQRRRTMSWCQRTIVSGATSSRSPCRRAFGITASRVASSAPLYRLEAGRSTVYITRMLRTLKSLGITLSVTFDTGDPAAGDGRSDG